MTVRGRASSHDLLMNGVAPDNRYGPLKYAGIEPFAGQPALRIDGRDALGAPIQFYCAAEDTLPLGYRVQGHRGGAGPVITTVSDWSEQDGFRWPRAARFRQGDEVFDYRIVSVTTADAPDPAQFLPGTVADPPS